MAVTSRAVTHEQKQMRRADLLKVAMACFADTSYDDISMAAIAAEAGVAKGTLYLYFRSKEEMFLALYEEELARWFEELDAALEHNRRGASFDGIVQLMSDSLHGRAAFLRLIAILHTVLERNVDRATALRFKTSLRERMLRTGALLEACLPFLKAGQGADLLLKINALVIGFEHLAEPSSVVRDVLQEPDMALFRVNLTEQLLATLRTLLMGLAYEAKYRNER